MTSAPKPYLFSFEAAQTEPLTFIPLGVRFYLDRCGARLSLVQWQALSESDRAALASSEPAADDPSTQRYEALLESLAREHSIGPIERQTPTPVDEIAPQAVPETVISQAAQHSIDGPSQAAWDQLSVAQRYALTKLARKARRSEDFASAMREFGIT
jgi:hypothetical protein